MKHLILSDLHVPDHNVRALEAVYKFIPDLKPDKVHLLGDLLNFTEISKYAPDPYYHFTITDEIHEAREILKRIGRLAKCEILLYEGNHELRLIKFLGRNAEQLAELDLDGERVISLPHLLNLKELGIRWIPDGVEHKEHGVILEHGDICRIKGGYTGHALIDRRATNIIVGHTHKLALISRNQGGVRFAIESGCLCNLRPTPMYVRHPDWQNGFTVLTYKNGQVYPEVIPIVNNSFYYGGKVYGSK
jgi:hypothetical protein